MQLRSKYCRSGMLDRCPGECKTPVDSMKHALFFLQSVFSVSHCTLDRQQPLRQQLFDDFATKLRELFVTAGVKESETVIVQTQ